MADERKIAANAIDRLFDFLDGLRASGYKIDTRQYIALSDLLMALVARGRSLDGPQLKTLIAPLICSTPAEQHDFYSRYDRWNSETAPRLDRQDISAPRENKGEASSKNRTIILFGVVSIAVTILLLLIIYAINSWAQFKLYFEIIASVLTLGVAIGQLVSLYRENQYITRKSAKLEPAYTRIPVHIYTQELMPPIQFKPISDILRRRTHILSKKVDVNRTIENSVRKNAWLEIVYEERRVVPEYLALIDRRSRLDQQARFVQEMLEGLVRDGIFLHQYEYGNDPRVCFPLNRKDSPLHFGDLRKLHPSARILVFSSIADLINPLTGQLQNWLELLTDWRERAIFAPGKMHKSLLEQLQACDIAVLPMTLEGMAYLGRIFEAVKGSFPFSGERPLPTSLTERPARWTGRDAPHKNELYKALQDIEEYLGDNGFYWLCSTAVYPELHWELTLFLGSVLRDAKGKTILDSDVLVRLAALPWFRIGYMPDWLRSILVEKLRPEREKRVRSALGELLSSAFLGEGFVLEIAQKLPDTLSARARSLLHAAILSARKESPQTDRIFVDFILKPEKRRLAVALPIELRKLLFGLRLFAPRLDRETRADSKKRFSFLDLILKTILDYTLAILGILIFAYLFPFISFAILFDSGLPIFVSQRSVGKRGRQFNAYRFRTTALHDVGKPHNTRVGIFLLRTGLHQLPLFYDVLRGNLSVVGSLLISSHEMIEYRKLGIDPLLAPPGITGLSQLAGGRKIRIEERARLDREYIKTWSVGRDLMIITRTIMLRLLKRQLRGEISPAKESGISKTAERETDLVSSKNRVLIVEDEPRWAERLRAVLSSEFNVTSSNNPQRALQTIQRRKAPFDVIITDLRLSSSDNETDESGLILLRELRRRGDNTQAIILTAYPTWKSTRKAFAEYQVYDYVSKDSLDPDTLRETVRNAADRAISAEDKVDQTLLRHQNDVSAEKSSRIKTYTSNVDVVILTSLPEEYNAVIERIRDLKIPMGTEDSPNPYGWRLGKIPSRLSGTAYRVVVGMTARGSNINSAMAIRDAQERWSPRYAFFTGIASGVSKLERGDVVLAETIYWYEYSKIERSPISRGDWSYRLEKRLRIAAEDYGEHGDWRSRIRTSPPVPCRNAFISGIIASTDKIIDNPTDEHFMRMFTSWSGIKAVETEGAGIAAAIEQTPTSDRKMEFLIVRGIADALGLPQETRSQESTKESYEGWKRFAAAAAASFTVGFISNALPIPPKRK